MSYSNHKPCVFLVFSSSTVLTLFILIFFFACLESEKQIKFYEKKSTIPRPILLVWSFLVFDPSIKTSNNTVGSKMCKCKHIFQRCIYGCVGQANQRHANKQKRQNKTNPKHACVCVFGKLSIFLCTREKTTEQVRKAGKRKNNTTIVNSPKLPLLGTHTRRETVYILPVFRFILLRDYLFVCSVVWLLFCWFAFDHQTIDRSKQNKCNWNRSIFAMNMNICARARSRTYNSFIDYFMCFFHNYLW